MNPFDSSIILWFNHLAVRSGTLTAVVRSIAENDLVQAVVPVTTLWFYWFRTANATVVRRNRELILATLLGSCVALALARGIAQVVPFRSRPFVAAIPGYHVIDPQWYGHFHQWNSFPSDHAALFFALATGIALISQRVGIAMLVYALLIDCVPRVYLGIHYPSDIAAGALLGTVMVCLVTRDAIRQPVAARVMKWLEFYPGLLYATLFICTFEVATMFDSAVQIAQTSAVLLLSANRHRYFARSALEAVASTAGIVCLALGVSLLICGYLLMTRRGARCSSLDPSRQQPLAKTAGADHSRPSISGSNTVAQIKTTAEP